MLKVDKNTLNRTKGRFARVCVKLDLNKPLLPSIMINGVEKKIEYEGLHLICFKCGKYGHDNEHCGVKEMLEKNRIHTSYIHIDVILP